MNKEKRKQKVLIVHNYYQIPGGEETVVANERQLLEEHGHKVVLYTRHNDELKKMNILQKIYLPFTTIFSLRTYKEVKRIIREQNIDVVHVHNTLSLISPSVYYAAVKMNVPAVQTIHNFRFLCPGATFYRDGHICEDCMSKGLFCAIKHKCYRNSRAETFICTVSTWIHRHTGILGKIDFITLTDFNREKLLQLKQIRPNKVFVKPNFTFKPSSISYEEEAQRNYYLFIGRIEEGKGVKLLIEASKQIKQQVFIAGDGPLRKEMEKTAPSNVKFLGYTDHNTLMGLIGKAKAVILPSQWYEGFSMTIPEAFAMHTPMIVGDIGNNGALIVDGHNGMKFKYDSAGDLIKTLERFEQTDKAALGEGAYSDYLNMYSAEANYKILRDIYNSIGVS